MVQRRLGVAREIAEDATAFAWLQLIRSRPEPNNIIGWLYTVAKHEALAAARGRAHHEPADDDWSERLIADPGELWTFARC